MYYRKFLFLTLVFCFSLILNSCFNTSDSDFVVKSDRLVERNDTTYQVNSNSPFTGTEVDSTNNVLTLKVEYKYGFRDGLYQEFHLNTQLKKEGKFEDGVKVGKWKTFYENGQLLSVGNYVNGKEDGNFKTYFRDGSIESEIMYKGGKKDGIYKKYHQNGDLNVDVRFSDGLYDSRYVELTSSQDTILTIDFSEGSFNGRFVVDISQYNSEGDGSELFDLISTSVGTFYFVSFDESGNYNLYEDEKFYLFEDDISHVSGFYKDGERDGRWVIKNVGKTSLELGYKDGVKDGELIKYFPLSDTPQVKGGFNDGSKNGLWRIYHPNGKVKIEFILRDGTFDGVFNRYYENGIPKLEGEFKNGKLVNVWTVYKPDGTLWKKRTYDGEDNYKLEEFDENGNVIYTTRMWY